MKDRVAIESEAHARSKLPPQIVAERKRLALAEFFGVSTEVISRRCDYEKITL
jgi:hypothetical protein